MTETRSASLSRLGDRGATVRVLRARLRAAGELPDGDAGTDCFDARVEAAVRAFQQRRGLIVDGLVGPQTYAALEAARWRLGDRLLRFVPGDLARGDDVAQLQERLLKLGFSPGRPDGLFGPATDEAVRLFQRGCGLEPDGTVGPATLRAFTALERSVSGGSPQALREREQVRRSGHRLAGRTVVLDPGHGGEDLGAVAHGVVEAEVVLDLAHRIEGRLSAYGVRVVSTRTEHTPPGDDAARAGLANDCGADVVLSLHCDSAEQTEASGVATFFYGGAEPCGARSAVGEHLADLIQRETVARTGLADCRSHARRWALLQRTRMPAVRVEAGYISNARDAARLADPAFRDIVAEGIVVALQRLYLGDADTGATGSFLLDDLQKVAESLAG